MSKRSEQQKDARDNSRQRIIDTATELFAARGYDATSIRMIASGAGIALGLTYNYFSGKEALLREICLKSMEDVYASFPAEDASQEPHEQIEELIKNCFQILWDHKTFWRLFYGIRFQTAVLDSLKDDLLQWNAAIFGRLERLFYEAGAENPAAEAHILQATIDGLGQQIALAPEAFPLEAVLASLLDKYKYVRMWRRPGN